MRVQRAEIALSFADDRGHAGAAVAADHGDAVDIGFRDAGKVLIAPRPSEVETFSPFQRNGVADAVDEIEIAALVLAHQVAGAEPGIALLEHVAEEPCSRSALTRHNLRSGCRASTGR
jgi:hypothetical protein